jgi:hypothetical protein
MVIKKNMNLTTYGKIIIGKALDRKKGFKLRRITPTDRIIVFIYRGIMVMYNNKIENMNIHNKYRFSTDIPGIYGETSTEIAKKINDIMKDHVHFDTGFRATCPNVGRISQTHCRLRIVIEEDVYVPLTGNIERVTCPLCFNEIAKIEIKKNDHHDTYGFQDPEDVLTYPGQMDWSKYNKDYWANAKKWGKRPIKQL